MINIFTFLWAQVSMMFMLVFIYFFTPSKLKLIYRIIILGGIYISCTAIDYIQYFIVKGDTTQILQSVVEAIIVQGAVFLLCEYKDFRALFTGLTAADVILVGNMTAIISYVATDKIQISLISQIVIHTVIILVLLHFCRQNWIWLMEMNWKYWGKLCCIPLLFWLVNYALTVWPQSIWDGENYKNLLAVIILLVLLEFSYFIMLAGLAYQYKMSEIERDNEYLEGYAVRLKQEADTLREQEIETAVIRHDLRHYFTQIQAYQAEGNTETVNEILRQLDKELVKITPKRYCENLAVNGVITHCLSTAERDDVKLAVEIEVPQRLSVNEFEFATVISNLLENAVNAAAKVPEKEKREVSITMRGVKGQMMLEIKNSYVGKLRFSAETGLPVSNGGKGHGYGLKSVLAFVRKNHAVFDYEIEENVVYVRLLV